MLHHLANCPSSLSQYPDKQPYRCKLWCWPVKCLQSPLLLTDPFRLRLCWRIWETGDLAWSCHLKDRCLQIKWKASLRASYACKVSPQPALTCCLLHICLASQPMTALETFDKNVFCWAALYKKPWSSAIQDRILTKELMHFWNCAKKIDEVLSADCDDKAIWAALVYTFCNEVMVSSWLCYWKALVLTLWQDSNSLLVNPIFHHCQQSLLKVRHMKRLEASPIKYDARQIEFLVGCR